MEPFMELSTPRTAGSSDPLGAVFVAGASGAIGTNRLRREGTDALLAAAREAGVTRFVAQSFASMRYAREGGPVKSEDDPLDPTPVEATRETSAA